MQAIYIVHCIRLSTLNISAKLTAGNVGYEYALRPVLAIIAIHIDFGFVETEFEGNECGDAYEVQLAYFSGAGGGIFIDILLHPGTASKKIEQSYYSKTLIDIPCLQQCVMLELHPALVFSFLLFPQLVKAACSHLQLT